jgi:FMN phosphatase YigB (HAD superfamily)
LGWTWECKTSVFLWESAWIKHTSCFHRWQNIASIPRSTVPPITRGPCKYRRPSKIKEHYNSTFIAKLDPKPYPLSLIGLINFQGKYIAAITEGPRDVQERSLVALGLTPLVDYLTTTNKRGAVKIHGIFPQVLQTVDVSAEEEEMVEGRHGSCDGGMNELRVIRVEGI